MARNSRANRRRKRRARRRLDEWWYWRRVTRGIDEMRRILEKMLGTPLSALRPLVSSKTVDGVTTVYGFVRPVEFIQIDLVLHEDSEETTPASEG